MGAPTLSVWVAANQIIETERPQLAIWGTRPSILNSGEVERGIFTKGVNLLLRLVLVFVLSKRSVGIESEEKATLESESGLFLTLSFGTSSA